MQVRYRYRIYPTPGQQQALARTFGCARVIYNDCLRVRDQARAAGETISDTEVQRRVVTVAKQTPERAWLAQVASAALVQACQDARRSVTVIKEADGRYYASFVVQRAATPLAACDREIGIDLGLASLAVTSDGAVVPNPRFLRAKERRLAIRQWACAACGTVHDRDVNAARNILAAGRADKSNACGGQVRRAPVLAPAGEAGTLRGAA